MTIEFDTLRIRCMNNGCCNKIREKRKYRICHLLGASIGLASFVVWNVMFWRLFSGYGHMNAVYIFLTPVWITLLLHHVLWASLAALHCWRKDIRPAVVARRAEALRARWPGVLLHSARLDGRTLWREGATLYHSADVLRFLLVVTPDPVTLYTPGGAQQRVAPPPALTCPADSTANPCPLCQPTVSLLYSYGYMLTENGRSLRPAPPDTVPSLTSIARDVIRKSLRPNVAYGAHRLSLPPPVRSFLLHCADLEALGTESVLRYLVAVVCLWSKRDRGFWEASNLAFTTSESVSSV